MRMEIREAITELFNNSVSGKIIRIDQLPQSGSDRLYFRVHCSDAPFTSCIATYNSNIRENNTFIYFTNTFHAVNAPVPEIFSISDNKMIYLQEDVGDECLLDIVEKKGKDQSTFELYKKSVKALASMQVKGDASVDYDECITSKGFGKSAILSDLLYFKYYFLDTLKIPYDKEGLINDFEMFSGYLADTGKKYFMFRDFQARNIMVRNNEVHFIDYQGGMKGALQYDVASLLWQAKADLSDSWKNDLFDYYMDCLDEMLPAKLERSSFTKQYEGYVLIRLLQVLGAYGFRGLFERKAHFVSSIPLALKNLRTFINRSSPDLPFTEFDRLMKIITGEEITSRFNIRKADGSTSLVVHINSFSYIQRGYPPDPSKHGGGFVFDCRGILNPGRIEEYKTLTGRDKDVINYIEQRTKMESFLTGVFTTVDIAVEDYINRGFDLLTINFGCTGGRHRSVYAADALARHLRNKYAVKLKVSHLEQNIYEEKF